MKTLQTLRKLIWSLLLPSGLLLVASLVLYALTGKTEFSPELSGMVLGLGLALAVKEGLRNPLEALLGDPLTARAVRYFLIVVVAGIVWPTTFRFFGKLGRKAGEQI